MNSEIAVTFVICLLAYVKLFACNVLDNLTGSGYNTPSTVVIS